ncbi:MAG: FkbM family methyltransferase [Chthoniobacterales bacterium]
MKDWLKKILPRWLQYFVYRLAWDPVRRLTWRALGLENTLPGGIRVRVRSHPDWVIYNEVIVNGEYDFVIGELLDRHHPGSSLRVVDLGANVGYFSFRLADLFVQRFGASDDLTLTLVEGSPVVYRELQRRVQNEPFLRDRVTLINGLAGKRKGGAYISQGYIHYGHGASADQAWGARFVPYVDLATVVDEFDRIDLLKCDIEGAEFDLIDNYTRLLEKTNSAVIEFHYYGRDVDRAREQLRALGFKSPEVLSAVAPCSVEYFQR